MFASPNTPIPERYRSKLEKKWGSSSWPALQSVVHHFNSCQFIGPLSLKDPGFLSFRFDPDLSIRVIASISRCGTDDRGVSLFDVVLTLWSSTIFGTTTKADPWYPVGAGYESWHQGYVACLVARLSHLKWASAETNKNPAWTMTSEGVVACIADLDSLAVPKLRSLRSNDDLAEFLTCVMTYQRPPWVRSDSPGMRNIAMLVAALQRGTKFNGEGHGTKDVSSS